MFDADYEEWVKENDRAGEIDRALDAGKIVMSDPNSPKGYVIKDDPEFQKRKARAEELIAHNPKAAELFDDRYYPIPARPVTPPPSPAYAEWQEIGTTEPVTEGRVTRGAGKLFITRDSGKKAQYADGMQRDTSEGKPQFTLMFPKGVPYDEQLITRVAWLYKTGAEKYSQPKLVEPQELVSWCTCGHQTAILTGLTTLNVCAGTAMSAISKSVTQSLQSASAETPLSGSNGINRERVQQTWLTASEALSAAPSVTDTVAGPVSDWLLRLASNYLLTQLAGAQSVMTTLDQARTWITTTALDGLEDFCVHAATKAWDSLEIQKKLFGEHSPTCSTRQLRATSKGISSGLGRNWEKSSTEDSLAHHEDAFLRHVFKFLLGVEDGEDHAAAVVWNVNAIDLTRRNIREAKTREAELLKAEVPGTDNWVDGQQPKFENPLKGLALPHKPESLKPDEGDKLTDIHGWSWTYTDNEFWYCEKQGLVYEELVNLAKYHGTLRVGSGKYTGLTIEKDGTLRWE